MVMNGHNHNDFSGKNCGCEDYIRALEQERRKIEVFQRELPLCLELVMQAIDSCKQQLSGTTAECNFNGQSECNSDQTSSQALILEEFIPIKTRSLCEEHEASYVDQHKKSDWLRSAQLWNNHTPDPVSKENSPRKVAVVEVKRTGAFHPFKKEMPNKDSASVTTSPQEAPTIAPPAATTNGGSGKKEDKEAQLHRKSRRCWSPELHRRFVQALQQLGGSHAATPKQIRELMKVDGLTNDEVKSHLQKYRLHTRRPSPTVQSNTTNQTPQFAVVVGGIWAVPPEYATGEVASGVAVATSEIYTPIPVKSSNLRSKSGEQDHRNAADSPASSSSTQTTTTSPPVC